MTMTLRKIAVLTCLLLVTTAVRARSEESPLAEQSTRDYQFLMARFAAASGDLAKAEKLFGQLIDEQPDNAVLHYERARVLLSDRKIADAEKDLRVAVANSPDLYDAQKLLGRVLLDRSGGDQTKVTEALGHLQKAYQLDPDDLATGLTVAQVLVSLGRDKDAAPILKGMVERAPDIRSVNFAYAQLLTKLGRGDESVPYLERVVEQNPDFKPAVFQLADIYQQKDEWKKAADILEPIVQSEPLDLDLQRRQAFMYLRAGESAKARDGFAAVLKADPTDNRSKFFMAEALSDLGQNEEAEPLYVGLLEKNPDDPDLLVGCGINELTQRKYDQAEERFKHILDLENVPDGMRRLALTQIAGIAHARGHYDEALKQARDLVDNGDRPNLQAINIALDVLQRKKQFREAVELMRPLYAKYADKQAVRARWVESLYRAGDDREGRKVVEASLASGFDDAMAAEQGLAQAERYKDAIGVLQKLEKDHPDNLDVMFQMGAMLERSGRKQASEGEFLKLLAKYPDNAPTLNYLGYMWAEDGVHLDKAAAMIQKAVDQAPNNGAYVDSLGWVYFRLGKLDLAKKHLTEAVSLMPDDSTVQQHLGDVLVQLGELDQALKVYQTALGLNPTKEDAASLRGKISDLEKRVASNAIQK